MTTTIQPTGSKVLNSLVDDLCQPVLAGDSGPRLASPAGDARHPINAAPDARTRATSQGYLVASLTHSRRFRLWRPGPRPEPPVAAVDEGRP